MGKAGLVLPSGELGKLVSFECDRLHVHLLDLRRGMLEAFDSEVAPAHADLFVSRRSLRLGSRPQSGVQSRRPPRPNMPSSGDTAEDRARHYAGWATHRTLSGRLHFVRTASLSLNTSAWGRGHWPLASGWKGATVNVTPRRRTIEERTDGQQTSARASRNDTNVSQGHTRLGIWLPIPCTCRTAKGHSARVELARRPRKPFSKPPGVRRSRRDGSRNPESGEISSLPSVRSPPLSTSKYLVAQRSSSNRKFTTLPTSPSLALTAYCSRSFRRRNIDFVPSSDDSLRAGITPCACTIGAAHTNGPRPVARPNEAQLCSARLGSAQLSSAQLCTAQLCSALLCTAQHAIAVAAQKFFPRSTRSVCH